MGYISEIVVDTSLILKLVFTLLDINLQRGVLPSQEVKNRHCTN